MMLSLVELMGITPAKRLRGRKAIVREGNAKITKPRYRQRKRDPVRAKVANDKYRQADPERRKEQDRLASQRRYWKNPDYWRKYFRERPGKLKAERTPEEWAKQLAKWQAAKVKRDQDPIYREMRLAKARKWWAEIGSKRRKKALRVPKPLHLSTSTEVLQHAR